MPETIENPHRARWLTAIAVFIIAAALGASALYYFSSAPGENGVSVQFSAPDEVDIGTPFLLTVSLANVSQGALEDATFSLALPEGLSFVGDSQDKRVRERAIGDLSPSNTKQEEFSLIAVSGVHAIKRIEAKLTYVIEGSTARFDQLAYADISIGEPLVSFTLNAPERAASGNIFALEVGYLNNSERELSGLKVRMEYPSAFRFSRGDPLSTKQNSVWELPALKKGEHGSIKIEGDLSGPADTFYPFRAALFTELEGQSYTLNVQSASVAIAPSPLLLSLSLNGKTDYVARLGDVLTYTLRYKNNADIAFQNVSAKAALAGELFDFRAVQAPASFDSIRNTFTWNVANTPNFALVPPGAEGELSLQLNVKESFPVRRLSDKNYFLKVQGQIESPTVPRGTAAAKTVAVDRLETKVRGELRVDAAAYYREQKADIVNAGPFPPHANRATQYTVHWTATAVGIDMSNVELAGFLQSGARWTGNTYVATGTPPQYDAGSGKVTWRMGKLLANKGVIGAPLEAVFQVEITPAINQVGQDIVFFGATAGAGEDAFTGLALGDTDESLSTGVPDDVAVFGGDRRVQP